MRRAAFLGAVLAFLFGGTAAHRASFIRHGLVARVIDGDTLVVTLDGARKERVRLIGIDAPERGDCYATQATARARQLPESKRVTLKGDPTQVTRDRYHRLLAYLWLPRGRDFGFQLIAGGFAHVYVFRDPFRRLSAYRNAEAQARSGPTGLWHACAAPGQSARNRPASPPAAESRCDPNYAGYWSRTSGTTWIARHRLPHRTSRRGRPQPL